MKSTTRAQRSRRQHRIRTKLKANALRPRLCVYRSNQWMEVQLVDDQKSHTLVGMNERVINVSKEQSSQQSVPEEFARSARSERAYRLGWLVAQKAKALGVAVVQFDRSGYRYHGRVRAVAEGARAGGLRF